MTCIYERNASDTNGKKLIRKSSVPDTIRINESSNCELLNDELQLQLVKILEKVLESKPIGIMIIF